MVYVAEKLATKKRQEKRIDVNEIRILGWLYLVTRRKDKTRNEHMRVTTCVQKDHREKIELIPKRDKKRRRNIVRTVLMMDIPGKRNIGRRNTKWKVTWQRDLNKSTCQRAGEELDWATSHLVGRSSAIPATLYEWEGKGNRGRIRAHYQRTRRYMMKVHLHCPDISLRLQHKRHTN